MLQAAHRLRLHRPNGRARVRLILVSALPIDELPPTSIVRDQQGEKKREDRLTPLIAALQRVVEEQEYATQAAVAAAAGVSTSTVSRKWKSIVEAAGLQMETRRLRQGAVWKSCKVAVPLNAQGSDVATAQ